MDSRVASVDCELGRRVLEQEAEAILSLSKALDVSFGEAVEWVLACNGRVITCGVGKSGHIARKAAGTLSSTGTPSLFIHAGEASHGDLGMMTSADVVVLYSHSGETDEIVRLFPAIREIGARTILFTGRPDSSAGHLADLVVDTRVDAEACPNNLAPTTSTTVMLALSDALAVAAMERRGFTKEDFAKFHPMGSLGRRLLLRVTDVMRPLAEMATVARETGVLDVMGAITRAGMGAACVVGPAGELLGFISDGDLRRHFLRAGAPFESSAGEMMTTEVSTIESDLLAVEALESFQNLAKKVGEMPVVDQGRVVGLLMLKDLLRSGIL